MEAGPLPPLGMQKSLACQECSREMADYRRVPHPIKVLFCRTRLTWGRRACSLSLLVQEELSAYCSSPPHCPHPTEVLLQPPLLHRLDLRYYPWAPGYQRQDAQMALRGMSDCSCHTLWKFSFVLIFHIIPSTDVH